MANAKKVIEFVKSDEQRRQEKRERRIAEKHLFVIGYNTSKELFDDLIDNIEILRSDESDTDLSVANDMGGLGHEYDIELILEIISNLRDFTRYIKYDDDEAITEFGLDYLRSVFNAGDMCED